ncbi:MAG: hypothetical protein HY000_25750 [Planctomycetes bacterium]|nr:hypothetical protein [Planctomycetota bacterium]
MTTHNTNKWDRRAELLGVRLRAEVKAARPVSVAEFYLAVGQAVRRALRGGLPREAIARGIGLPICECELALVYANSADWLKLRALVEDWSWKRIKDSLRSVATPSQRMSG